MTGITSTGLGSGLDVNSIVSQLVAAERAPGDKRILLEQSRANYRISALGTFRSSIASLQAAADSLKISSTSTFGKLATTSSDTTLFTASASAKAVAGTYNVEVVSLATASKLASSAFANSTAPTGAGDVTLNSGGKSFTVTLNDTSTLADLRDKINNAIDNVGVSATLVNDAGGTRLLLTSKATGTVNAVTATTTLFTTSSVQTATDAVVKVDGFTTTSANNQVTGAIDGITLNLAKQVPGTTTQLTVNIDQSAATASVQAFVSAYNQTLSTLSQLTSYNTATKTAGPLLGDSVAQGTIQKLRNLLSSNVSGNGTYENLSSIGITTSKDGTLNVDAAKLGTALTTDFSAVKRLFGDTGGLATKVSVISAALTDISGPIKNSTDSATAQLNEANKEKTAQDRKIADYQARTLAQFTALDRRLSQLNATSTYLTQQLAKL